MTPAQAFVEQLAHVDVRITKLLLEHKRDHDESLPHLFMGDVARFAGELARHRGPDDDALDELLAAIERALTSGLADVEELVVVSFLENLHQTGDAYGEIARRLGPRSRCALDLVERER